MSDDSQIATHEVPNPDYVELQRLLAKARHAADQFGGVLDRPANLMGASRVWTGPSVAAGFAVEVAGRRAALATQFEAFIEEIEHRIARTEPTTLARTRVW